MSNRDRRLIETALSLAEQSPCKQRHGAIVVKGGRILGKGFNEYRNEPQDWMPVENVSIHAEIAAMSGIAPDKLKGATVYVARRGRCNVHACSRPCPRCYDALVKAGVKKIIYT